MALEIDYFNARIRGMSGQLLDKGFHLALLTAPTIDSWISALRETPYHRFLVPAAKGPDSRPLYRAVDNTVASCTRRLTRIAEGRPARALRICIGEWDLQNLLAVTGGLYHNAAPMDILSGTLAGGLLGSDQLEALAHSGKIRKAADLLTTWRFPYHQVYRGAVGRYEERSLPQMRLDLAGFFLGRLRLDAAASGYPVLMKFMEDRIDQTNLMTSLMWRVLPSDRDPAEFFIPGGRSMDEKCFRRVLASPTVVDASSALPPGRLRKIFEEAAPALDAGERISSLDRALERKMLHHYARPMARKPLGIELLLSYVLRLREEGTGLKLTLTRLLLDIPAEVFTEVAGHG